MEKKAIGKYMRLSDKKLRMFVDAYRGMNVSQAIEIYKKNKLDPRDAIHLAAMQSKKIKTIYSSDSDFDKIKEIKRIDFRK